MYVMSIDPGLATGYSLLKRNDPDPPKLIETGEADWRNTYKWIDKWLELLGGQNVDVVVERFIITAATAKKTQAPYSLEGIGQARMLADIHGAGELIMQTSSNAESFTTSKQLKAIGLWHKGGEGHANLSLHHAVLYLANTGYVDRRMLASSASK
jgi:hypothetical protein